MNSLENVGAKTLNSLFRMAVLAGVEVSVRMHMDRGDDVNARDGNGMTPLMLAASKNKAAICALLLSRGADFALVDPSGRDAMGIARLAGANDALAAMEPFAPKNEQEAVKAGDGLPVVSDDGATTVQIVAEIASIDEDGDMEDMSSWEAEDDKPAPAVDVALVEAAVASHGAISSHVPVDDAMDWEGFDGLLPEEATPLPTIDEEGAFEKVASIIRRALREGCVPDREIQQLFEAEDWQERAAKQDLLRTVLADLGAETDERLEFQDSDELWPERQEDEDEAREAWVHYQELLARRNDPSRHYMRELPKVGKLLTAADEQALGQAMEEGLSAALDALAAWPQGVAEFLAASIDAGKDAAETELDADSEHGEGQRPEEAEPQDGDEDLGDDREFKAKAEGIGLLAHLAGAGAEEERPLRRALDAAKPPPHFLARIGDSAGSEGDAQAAAFHAAIARHAKAKERLVCSNLRLVIAFVKKFAAYGLPFDDLVQEGNIGLMKAADRFEWRRGNKFSTYATWWIRQSVTRALADKVLTIRRPVHIHNLTLKMVKDAERLQAMEGRHVPRVELASMLSMPLAKFEDLMARWEEPVPLHEPDADGFAPVDFLADSSRLVDPYAMEERSSLLGTLGRLLAHLPAREGELMTMRFGLDGEDPRTLEELGIHYGVTRERIRQIEAAALKMLAKAIHSDPLRTFLDGAASAPKLVKADPSLADCPPIERKARKPGMPRAIVSLDGEADLDSSPLREADAEEQVTALPYESERFAQLVAGANANGGNATYRAIEMAKAAGAVVVDLREDGGGVMVQLVSEESRHRVVIRKLLSVGFEQYAGMEFRK